MTKYLPPIVVTAVSADFDKHIRYALKLISYDTQCVTQYPRRIYENECFLLPNNAMRKVLSMRAHTQTQTHTLREKDETDTSSRKKNILP